MWIHIPIFRSGDYLSKSVQLIRWEPGIFLPIGDPLIKSMLWNIFLDLDKILTDIISEYPWP